MMTRIHSRVSGGLNIGALVLLAALSGAGCFGSGEDAPAEAEQTQKTPAEQARIELKELRARLKASSPAAASTLQRSGARIAQDEPTTRAAAKLVLDLHRSMSTGPMQLDPSLAATSPTLAGHIRDLRAALQEHHGLLSDLRIVPLPAEPDPAILDGPPDAEMVEAAIQVEEATEGRWPLKRVFIAYAMALESIRDEAAALEECAAACPEGVAEEAVLVRQEAERLSALLEEFAALYC